ncbi:MAG: Abi family protein, partial [Treponema sp.]|nr:Abi family protein [Treponema sp.]
VIEAVLADCGSENLSEVYKKSLTYYKEFSPKGGKQAKNSRSRYRQEFKKRKDLEMRISSALIRDYMQGRDIESHFFDNDRDVPLWATFESLTLGEFGVFLSCTNRNIKMAVSEKLGLRKSLNADGDILTDIIFCLKDLRNAIAHNGVIFDTRFARSKVKPRISKLLQDEMGVSNVDFSFIVSYVVLIVYLLKTLKESSKDCRSFINEYEKSIEMLLSNFPKEVYFKISGTQEKGILEELRKFVESA